jgi:Rrf2 family transcriptional regulator, nitric oxide-sensitive transcriptional repressor
MSNEFFAQFCYVQTMRLSLHTDYGLRVLMQVACTKDDERITIDDIANAFSISKSHLTKVVQTLAHEGLLHTTRGRSGGLALGRPPSEIRLGHVVRMLEASDALVECQALDGRCVLAPACALRGILEDATAAFFRVLDDATLLDLVRKPQRLIALLAG